MFQIRIDSCGLFTLCFYKWKTPYILHFFPKKRRDWKWGYGHDKHKNAYREAWFGLSWFLLIVWIE